MFVLALPLFLGLTFNTLNDHPKTCADVRASIIKEFTAPVKAPGGPYNK